jgi:hypothetical protein
VKELIRSYYFLITDYIKKNNVGMYLHTRRFI